MECDVRKLEQYIEIFAALRSVLLTVRETPGLVRHIVIGLQTVFGNANMMYIKSFQTCQWGKRYSHLYVKPKEQWGDPDLLSQRSKFVF